MRMQFIALVLAAWFTATAAAPVSASEPTPAPQQVVAIQLDALRQNDVPSPDAGIARVWEFAHPDNQRVTGPLDRFTQMIKGGAYSILINHRSHQIEPLALSDETATFSVTVTGSNGTVAGFLWAVSKVSSVDDADTWMTTGVSPAALRGKDA